MEYQQQNGRLLYGAPGKLWRADESMFDECRSLVRILRQKTETLDRKHRVDPDIAMHIQTMGSTLATLADLINRLDHPSRAQDAPEILIDSRGFTYQSVRSCDLELISDK